MNYVAHLFLAKPKQDYQIGALLADFCVGTIEALEQKFGVQVANGIKHHRFIDRFTDEHPSVIHSVDVLKPALGMYSSIAVDVVYDHFLLNHWKRFCKLSKESFFASIYVSLSKIEENFPPRYKQAVTRMLERRWLRTYEELENVAYALSRINERFSRQTPLKDALSPLKQNYASLEHDFLTFFPTVVDFAKEKADDF